MPPPVRLPLYSPNLQAEPGEAASLEARAAEGGSLAALPSGVELAPAGDAPGAEGAGAEGAGAEGAGADVPATDVPADTATEEARGDELMQVGDLARVTGKTVRAIHLYEELQLLRPAARSKGRYRLYGREALLRIRWIGKLQDMGFSLTDIQTIVKDWEQSGSAPHAMVKVREVYQKKLAETREHLRKLEALEHELEASLDYLDTCDVCDPARLLSACRSCELHGCNTHVPDLIAGFRAN